MAPTQPGVGLDLTGLCKIVDYTPRDMTILVEAGVRMADLAAMLAAEGQQLPIDVPRAGEATIGGVVATNWNGPRRYGYGTIRDYVIGIHAVDGRGVAFKGGGRVVKNVAGYDFCKLLTGSLGTLGVITQLALKVKPLPEQSATIVADVRDLRDCRHAAGPAGASWRRRLSRSTCWLATSGQVPMSTTRSQRLTSAYECCTCRSGRRHRIGDRLARGTSSIRAVDRRRHAAFDALMRPRPTHFGSSKSNSPTAARATRRTIRRWWSKSPCRPARTTAMIAAVLEVDPDCTIQAHAGNGILVARFARFTHADLTNVLVGKLRPAAVQLGGSLWLSSSKLEGLTPHLIWGGRTEAIVLLERIKQKFDPHNILNPGRFVF